MVSFAIIGRFCRFENQVHLDSFLAPFQLKRSVEMPSKHFFLGTSKAEQGQPMSSLTGVKSCARGAKLEARSFLFFFLEAETKELWIMPLLSGLFLLNMNWTLVFSALSEIHSTASVIGVGWNTPASFQAGNKSSFRAPVRACNRQLSVKYDSRWESDNRGLWEEDYSARQYANATRFMHLIKFSEDNFFFCFFTKKKP